MKCYLCGKNKLKVIRTKLRHDIPRNVLECQSCGIVYLEPGSKVDLKDYYKNDYRKLYSPVIGKALNSQEIFDIYLPYQQERIEKIKHLLNPDMSVLDVGCSSGHFLYALKNHVKECIGIEFNKENAEFASKKLGIKVYTEPIQDTGIPLGYFDLITAYEVLEHMDDPIKFLTIIRSYLKPDGFLVVEVPNIQDALISVYGSKPYSDFWFREPHVFYYSPKTLTMMLAKAGFSGSVKTIQLYNFLNHMNWLFAGKPEDSAETGMSEPRLIKSDSVNPEVRTEFNKWIQKVDKEYKQLLERYDFGENILFIGKKQMTKN